MVFFPQGGLLSKQKCYAIKGVYFETLGSCSCSLNLPRILWEVSGGLEFLLEGMNILLGFTKETGGLPSFAIAWVILCFSKSLCMSFHTCYLKAETLSEASLLIILFIHLIVFSTDYIVK